MDYKKITTYAALLSLSGTLLTGCSTSQITKKGNDSRQIVRADVLSDQEQLVKKLSIMMDEKEAFDAGNYKKGELKKGDYVFINMNNNATPAHFKEKNGGEMFFQSFGYVTISGDEEVSFERGFIIPVDKLDQLNVSGAKELYEKYNGIKDYKGPGYYKIGTDIDRGLVTVQSTGKNSYAALLTSPTRKEYNIAAMNYVKGDMVIDTNRGSYLNLNNAKITKVEKGKKKDAPKKTVKTKNNKPVSVQQNNFLCIHDEIYIENTFIMFLSYELMAQFNYFMNMNLYFMSLEFNNSNEDTTLSFYDSRKQKKEAIAAEKAIENKEDASKDEKEEADKVQEAARQLLENLDLQFAGKNGEGKLNQEIIDLTRDGVTFDGVTITNDGNLSNDDKETLSLYYNGEVVAESKVTVSGLEETERDDKELEKLAKEALDKAKLTFNGVNGQGFTQPTIVTIDGVTFNVYADKTNQLSNGDKITLYISYNDEVLGDKEVEVTDLKENPEENTKDEGYKSKDYADDVKEEQDIMDNGFDTPENIEEAIGEPAEDLIEDTITLESDETDSEANSDEEDKTLDEEVEEEENSSDEETDSEETSSESSDEEMDSEETEETDTVDEDTAEEDAEYEASLSREEEEYEASLSREAEEEAKEQEIIAQGQVVADQLANSMTFSGEDGSGVASTGSAPSPYTEEFSSTSGLYNDDSVDVTVYYNGEEVGSASATVTGLTEPEEEMEEDASLEDEAYPEGDEYEY